jgi:hypothetical protein
MSNAESCRGTGRSAGVCITRLRRPVRNQLALARVPCPAMICGTVGSIKPRTAYFFLFAMWPVAISQDTGNLAAARAALVDPLRHVYGVSDKVIAMALATMLMGAGAHRPGWFDVGASFIVIDTLVHNFLARTGIGPKIGTTHPYGPACYRPAGCADVIATLANAIDARQFNSAFPKTFPRFVQHAIWRYCAQSCFDICNGNQIDDDGRCANMWCRLYGRCDRLALREPLKNA